MTDENLKFSDVLAELDQLGKGEWIAAYAAREDIAAGPVFYSALIREDRVAKSLEDSSWDLRIGSGGPGFWFHYENGEQVASYHRYSEEGVEPLVLMRSFHNIKPGYPEIAEEFRLYFNLYDDRRNNKLVLINEDGDEEDAVLFCENEIKIKLRLIKEFSAAKKMRLGLFFDVNRFSEKDLAELGIKAYHELRKGDDFVLSIGAQAWHGLGSDKYRSHGFLLGKKLIPPAADFKGKNNLRSAWSSRWPKHSTSQWRRSSVLSAQKAMNTRYARKFTPRSSGQTSTSCT